MSWLSNAGRTLWRGAKVVGRGALAVGTGGLSEVAIRGGETIFGTGDNPGILGTGQMQVRAPEVNMTAGVMPQSQVYQERAERERQTLQGRAPAQSARIDTTRADEARAGQQQLTAQLQAAAQGQGPSVAQEQLRQGTERNLAGAVAMANSLRGVGGAGQAAQLQAARAQAGQQMASDAALLRAEEVTQARGQLAGVLGDVREADLATAGQQAQLEQQTALENQRLQQQRDELTRQYIEMGYSMADADRLAAMQMEEMRVNAGLETERIRAGAYEGAAGRRIEVAGRIASAIGQAAGAGAGGLPKGGIPKGP